MCRTQVKSRGAGSEPIESHCRAADARLTTSLLAADADTALIDAVKRGDHNAVRALLRGKPDVNAPGVDGTTALHWAVQGDDAELVTMLLRAGASAKATNRYGLPPITLAAMNGSAKVIEALLSAGADPNTNTTEGEPVIMTAARTGTVDALKALIARGANVNAREKWFGETAVMWAASENHGDAIRVLAEAGADLNARSTLLDAPVLEFPRSGGPNSPLPRGGWTALMFAARDGATDAARALADLGADLNATALPQTDVPLKPEEIAAAQAKNIGTSALVYAIINVHYDLAAVLLDKGADPNVVDGAGMGALYAAVDMNSLQWVQGRPAPILSDHNGRRRSRQASPREGRESERAPERQAAEASPRRRIDAELRRRHDAPDSRGPDQRRCRDEGAARGWRRSVPDAP